MNKIQMKKLPAENVYNPVTKTSYKLPVRSSRPQTKEPKTKILLEVTYTSREAKEATQFLKDAGIFNDSFKGMRITEIFEGETREKVDEKYLNDLAQYIRQAIEKSGGECFKITTPTILFRSE